MKNLSATAPIDGALEREVQNLAPKVWGATSSEPVSIEEWRANFAAWCMSLWWFIEHTKRGGIDAKRAAKIAPATSLLRPPRVARVTSETRAALWQLRGDLSSEPESACELDLTDPQTLLFWVDFISEHVERYAAWQRFQRENGVIMLL